MSPETDELLGLLDPDRDYGDRTYEEVVTAVQNGAIAISPGYKLPMLRDVATRRILRGSGPPAPPTTSVEMLNDLRAAKRTGDGRAWFESRMTGAYAPPPGPPTVRDMIFDKMMDAIRGREKSWEKLAIFALEQHIGKPRETSNNSMGRAVDLLIKTMGGDTAEMRMVELPVQLATQPNGVQ